MSHFKIVIYGESPLTHDEIGDKLLDISDLIEEKINGEISLSYSPDDDLNEETKQAIKDSFEHPERGKRFSSIEEAFAWLNSNEKDIPTSCRNCSNHPSNGGSVVCFCTLGMTEIR